MPTESTNDTGIDALEAVSLDEAARALGDFVLRAAVGRERFRLTRYGKDAAGLIGLEDLKRLGIPSDTLDPVQQQDARVRIGELVVLTSITSRRFLLTRYENDSAAIVPLSDLETLVRLDHGAEEPDAPGRRANMVGADST